MNIYRRLLSITLIVVSCLFTIQSASADHALNSGSAEQACDEIGPLPKLSMSFLAASAPSDNRCSMDLPHTTPVAIGQRASSCPNIGPTLFNLGLSATVAPNLLLNIPTCLTSGAVGNIDSDESEVAEASASSGNETPIVVRNRSSQIGPRID